MHVSSIDDTLKDWGAWAAAGRTSNPPRQAQQVDALLGNLTKKHQDVLKAHYCIPGTVKQKAESLNMTQDAFKEYAKHARELMDAWLP